MADGGFTSLTFILKYTKKRIGLFIAGIVLLIILTVVALLPPYLTKLAFDEGIMERNTNMLMKYVLFLVGAYLLQSVINYSSSALFTYLNQNILLDMKKDLNKRILNLPLAFFTTNESGYILARMKEVDSLSTFFSMNTLRTIVSIFEFVGALFIMFSLSIKLTLLLLLIVPVFGIVTKIFGKSLKKFTQASLEKGAMYSSKMQQAILGGEEIKRLGIEDKQLKQINIANEQLAKTMIKRGILMSGGTELLILSSSLASVFLLYLGGTAVLNKNISIGTYMAFAGYFSKLYAPVLNWNTTILTFKPAFVALQRIRDFFFSYQDEIESEDEIQLEKIKEIEMKNINFKYPDGNENIIENFHLIARKGDKILLKGPNGSGKSTIIRLLLGFYNNYEGDILINGVELKNVSKKSVRKRCSIVSQRIFLLNSTIEENIKIVGEVDDEQYQKALIKSGLIEFVNALPLGDKTLVGENGIKLSGGQIQKVAIARAIAKANSDIYVFDEAAAHLDTSTKASIKRFINEELNEKICIIIDHSNNFDELCNNILDLSEEKQTR